MLALTQATLIDGRGGSALPGAIVLVDGAVIAAAGPTGSIQVPEGSDVMPLDGLFLLPGLIDAHVHLGRRDLDLAHRVFVPEALWAARGAADLARLLRAGFTTVRDCGGGVAAALRRAVEEGSIPGPRILASGRWVERTGGADDACFMPLPWARASYPAGPRIADGLDQVRQAVREQIRDGADWIKTCATGAAFNTARSRTDILEWSTLEMETLVDEAHRLGVRVAVHAHTPNGIIQAIRAGADSIEHGTCIDDEACRMMADRGLFLVPTFIVLHRMATVGGQFGAPAFAVEKAAALDRVHIETFQRALHHGVRLAMGTDISGTALAPHGENADELALMAAAGLSPMDAIRAATSGAAEALGISHETGAVAHGLHADLVILGADPLRDLRAMRDVRMVIQGGRIVHDARTSTEGVQHATS
jgi:imidazolonepropionase-like amidohydrolase